MWGSSFGDSFGLETMAPRGRRGGTPNTPLAVRRSAVNEYKSRAVGVTRKAIADRYNVSVSALKVWVAEANAHDVDKQQFGANTVYCGLDRLPDGATKTWLQSLVTSGADMPSPSAVVDQFHAREPIYCSSRNYQALYKAAERLIQSVKREDIKYTSITRSVGVEQIRHRALPRRCKCQVSCDAMCPTRLDMSECTVASCSNGDNCENRIIQQGTELQFRRVQVANRGYGLSVAEVVEKDCFIQEYVGIIVDTHRRNRLYERGRIAYLMQLTDEYYIDATHYGNESRLINHSHAPNCRAELWWINGEPRVGIFARVKIKAGVELTFNYGAEYYIPTCGCARCVRMREQRASA